MMNLLSDLGPAIGAIWKPSGMSSRAALDFVQRAAKPCKVGHGGTLDPLARGVLVICVGGATRLIDLVHEWDKDYTAVFRLGWSSPSDDLETETVAEQQPRIPSRAEIEAVLPRFIGQIQQTPPAFSAVKINGRRAYRDAARGRDVQPAARSVTVHTLTIACYEYPDLTLQMTVGTGTYVRSLGRDLAAALQTVAVMSDLVRTRVGPFTESRCCAPQCSNADNYHNYYHSPEKVLTQYPVLNLSNLQTTELILGREIEVATAQDTQPTPDAYCWGITERSGCLGRLKQLDKLRYKPDLLFADAISRFRTVEELTSRLQGE